MNNIKEFRKKIERKKGQASQIQRDLKNAEEQGLWITLEIQDTEAAQVIIQSVAQNTQQELEYRLSEIVSLSLASVFDNPYRLQVEFNIKRGKTECALLFERDGNLYDPMFDNGGGVVDLAAMALQITLWSLKRPATRNVLIFDEPVKFISKEYQQKASLLIKELSKKLNLQIIMVSHSESLINGADKIFTVSAKNGIANVKSEEKAENDI